MKVYFDKNVLSHMIAAQRGDPNTYGVTREDVKAMFAAAAAGKVTCLLSFMHLQEASYVVRAASAKKANDELNLIQGLMDTTRIIKPCGQLLIDDVFALARGESPPSALMPLRYELSDLFRLDGDIEERKKALDDTDAHNEKLLNSFSEAAENDRALVLEEFGGKPPEFKEFFYRKIFMRMLTTIEKVEKQTSSIGLVDACKAQGIENMVRARSLFLADGVSLSYSHGRMFGGLKKKKQKRHGDPPDLHHALSASACDVFVTHDEESAFWMDRIPEKRIKVLDHVTRLFELIGGIDADGRDHTDIN